MLTFFKKNPCTLQKAMEIIGFTAEEISSIFELIAAILNIGNIEFEGYSLPNGTSACKLKNMEGKLKLI